MITKKKIISLTESACERIKYLLSFRDKDVLGIKVKVKKGGCSGLSYVIEYADQMQKYDEIIDMGEFKVIIDSAAILYLIGSEMDYVKEQLKEGFVFINPNEKGRCGCGESFHI